MSHLGRELRSITQKHQIYFIDTLTFRSSASKRKAIALVNGYKYLWLIPIGQVSPVRNTKA